MEEHDIEKYVFVDEVEFQEQGNRPLSLYFLGIEIPADLIDKIEGDTEKLLLPFGEKGFHAKDAYQSGRNKITLNGFNKIIVDNKLKVYCFPFVKDWLKREEFSILKSFTLDGWVDFPKSNYRALSLLLFLHVLNYHIAVNENQENLTRIIFDADWQNKSRYIVHEREVLTKIGNIYFTKQKKATELAISDHIAHLFYCIKNSVFLEDAKLVFRPKVSKKEQLTKQSLNYFKKLGAESLFVNLDVFEWIKYENKDVA